jgi:hypothetical protein
MVTEYHNDPQIFASIKGTDPVHGTFQNSTGWVSGTTIWSEMIYAPTITTTACGGFPQLLPPGTTEHNQGCANQ